MVEKRAIRVGCPETRMVEPKYFLGIDPGDQGGLGIVDQDGSYVAAARWDRRRPESNYERLLLVRDQVAAVYLERIQAHPREGMGHVVQTIPLITNWGIWQGWLLAVGLPWVLIHPIIWQRAVGLDKWQARVKVNPNSPTPLTWARAKWPTAPLQFDADDGKAVGLILAGLAAKDARQGFDRAAQVEHNARVARKAKAKARAAKKAAKAQMGLQENPSWPTF